MSLSGFSTGGNYLTLARAVAAMPMLMMAWARGNGGQPDADILNIGQSGTRNNRRSLQFFGAGFIGACSQDNVGTSVDARVAQAAATDTWEHFAAVLISDSDRRTWINGGDEATNTTLNEPTAPNQTRIGVDGDDAGGGDAFVGMLAHVSVFDLTGLTDEQIALLIGLQAAGQNPLTAHYDRQAPWYGRGRAYWMCGEPGQQPDLFKRGNTMSMVGTLTVNASMPPVLPPIFGGRPMVHGVAGL